NLEASPPVVADGVEYPLGRIYYGREGGMGLSPILAEFLADQTVQAPFAVDTTWLCVGHVDEFTSFVPDASSPKGFKFLFADTRAAWALIEGQPRAKPLGRYGPDHGYATVGAMLDDAHLRALNDDIQRDHLDPLLARFKRELGLTDDDVILVPSLFEEVPGCGGGVVALLPGTVNLIVTQFAGESTTKVFAADPF